MSSLVVVTEKVVVCVLTGGSDRSGAGDVAVRPWYPPTVPV